MIKNCYEKDGFIKKKKGICWIIVYFILLNCDFYINIEVLDG